MTFSPAMHKQVMAGAKSVTRRLNNTYRVGQIVAAVTHWHTNPWDDAIKPVDLDAEEPFKWFWMPNCLSASGGKLRQARFFPRHMYHLAPLRRIVDIRQEQLQAITYDDVLREGIESATAVPYGSYQDDTVEKFAELWDRINGAGAWAANPLVYRVEFEPVTNGQAMELFNQKASEK